MAEPGWVLNPEASSEYADGYNPYAVDWLPTDMLFVVGFSMVAVSLFAALIAVGFGSGARVGSNGCR